MGIRTEFLSRTCSAGLWEHSSSSGSVNILPHSFARKTLSPKLYIWLQFSFVLYCLLKMKVSNSRILLRTIIMQPFVLYGRRDHN
uniref:Uncharacterized protein n=1 Tax=Anguilla anguilla TaxID=7936 RepID=A0A0E9WI68_ANGAN